MPSILSDNTGVGGGTLQSPGNCLEIEECLQVRSTVYRREEMQLFRVDRRGRQPEVLVEVQDSEGEYAECPICGHTTPYFDVNLAPVRPQDEDAIGGMCDQCGEPFPVEIPSGLMCHISEEDVGHLLEGWGVLDQGFEHNDCVSSPGYVGYADRDSYLGQKWMMED